MAIINQAITTGSGGGSTSEKVWIGVSFQVKQPIIIKGFTVSSLNSADTYTEWQLWSKNGNKLDERLYYSATATVSTPSNGKYLKGVDGFSKGLAIGDYVVALKTPSSGSWSFSPNGTSTAGDNYVQGYSLASNLYTSTTPATGMTVSSVQTWGPAMTINYEVANLTTKTFTVSSSNDDGYYYTDHAYPNDSYTTGDISLGSWSGDPYFGYEGYIRFTNITIPPGVTITSSTLTANTKASTNHDTITLTLRADKQANAPALTGGVYDRDARTTSTSYTQYTFGANTTAGAIAFPSVISLIREIINLPDWQSGNAIQFLTQTSYAGDYTNNQILNLGTYDTSEPAQLTVTYIDDATGTSTAVTVPSPAVTSTVSQVPTITTSSAPAETTLNATVATGAADGYVSEGSINSTVDLYPGKLGSVYINFTMSIPKGATIKNATLDLFSLNTSTLPLKIKAEKSAAPGNITSATDYNTRIKTTTETAWNFTGISGWMTTPDFAAVIQEVVNAYDVTKLHIFIVDNGSSINNWAQFNSYDTTTTNRPKLTVTYTKAAASTPVSITVVVATTTVLTPNPTISTQAKITGITATVNNSAPIPTVVAVQKASITSVSATAIVAAAAPTITFPYSIAIERHNGDGNWQEIAYQQVAESDHQLVFTDNSELIEGTTYHYRVKRSYSGFESDYSTTTSLLYNESIPINITIDLAASASTQALIPVTLVTRVVDLTAATAGVNMITPNPVITAAGKVFASTAMATALALTSVVTAIVAPPVITVKIIANGYRISW